jgi:excisionase family DNA binding protein
MSKRAHRREHDDACGALRNRLALTVKETAEICGLSPPTIWRMLARGDLRSVLVGGRRLVPVDAMRALFAPSGPEA